jgi:integrase
VTRQSSHGGHQPVHYGGRKIPRASVYTSKGGARTYYVRMRMPDGTQPRIKLDGVTTPGECARAVENMVADRNRGVERENPYMSPTVGELLDEWLTVSRARVGINDEKLRLSPNTVDSWTRLVRHHAPAWFGRTLVVDVTPADIRRVLEAATAKGLSPSTVGTILSTLTIAFEFAVDSGYAPQDRNVVRDLPRRARPGRKRQSEPRYLTYDEVTALLTAAGERATVPLRPILACCFYAALRISETLGLQWECVDLKAGTLTVRQQIIEAGSIIPHAKTAASAATVELAPALKAELLAHRSRMAEVDLRRVHPEALVFVGVRGQPLRRSSTYSALRRVADRVGLNPPGLPPIGQHDLRHSAGALALQHGASPAEVAEFLRHENAEITMSTYAGLNADGRGGALRKLIGAGVAG